MISAVACVPRGAARARPKLDEPDPAEVDRLRQEAADAGVESMDQGDSDDHDDSDDEEAAVRVLLGLLHARRSVLHACLSKHVYSSL